MNTGPKHQRWNVEASLQRVALALVHSNLAIAASAAGVALTTVVLTGLPREPLPVLFVFVAAWFTYTTNRFTDRIEDARNLPERAQFIRRYGKPLLVTAGVAYAAFVGLTAYFAPRMLPFLALPVIGILAYARHAIKRHAAIKNGAVGAIWAAIPVGLGVYYGAGLDSTLGLIALVIFWHIVLAAALFDIKDVAGDEAIGSRTLPIVLSPDTTRQIVMVGSLFLLMVIGVGTVALGHHLAVLGVYPLHLVVFAPQATEDRGALFYGLVIDGEHLIVAALAIVVVVM